MSGQSTIERIKQTHPEIAEPKPLRSLNVAYDEKLDHMRFLAAFMIIIFHSFPPIFSVMKQVTCDWKIIADNLNHLNGLWLIPKAFVAEGHTAVGLFLTISGFLFSKICLKSDIITHKFYLNRLLRIYPLYLCFILLALYLNPGQTPFQSLCMSVFTLQNLPTAVSHPILTPHLWSVAVEFQIYLLFPVVLAEFRRSGYRALFLFLALSIGLKSVVYLLSGDVQSMAYHTVFGRFDQFIIGAILAFSFESYSHKIRHGAFLLTALGLLIAVIVSFHVCGGSLYTGRKSIWIIWPAIEALVWGTFLSAYCASSFRIPVHLSKILTFMGGIGYSLYVTHYLVINLVTPRLCAAYYNFNSQLLIPFLGSSQQEAFAISVVFGAFVILPFTVLASCLTYYAIEKPFMNLRVKYTKPINTDTVSPR